MNINKNKNDVIQRWRVIAMLNNIKNHINDDNYDLEAVVDNYIEFAKMVDKK